MKITHFSSRAVISPQSSSLSKPFKIRTRMPSDGYRKTNELEIGKKNCTQQCIFSAGSTIGTLHRQSAPLNVSCNIISIFVTLRVACGDSPLFTNRAFSAGSLIRNLLANSVLFMLRMLTNSQCTNNWRANRGNRLSPKTVTQLDYVRNDMMQNQVCRVS